MDRIQLYEDRYDLEWDRRAHLLRMTNLCIVASTVIGTTLVTAAQSFDYQSGWVVNALFLFAASLSSLAVLLSFCFICMALIDRGYCYIPSPRELKEYYHTIEDWCSENAHLDESPDSIFSEFVSDQTVAAAEFNIETNTIKASRVRFALISIFVSMTFLFLSAIPYLLSALT